ncbi:hypothetical protein [uncultured Clostridium sp.]|uniref:hypothetical protein n=1 Tax=uncultured Clostridium sp. TaxID=59620 RepID=UPI0025F41C55|nr:hypothetical protein [uncultured Clostridium sp.]
MKNIKVILSTILILIINLFVGCSNINEKKEEKLDLFDVFKGKDLAINYLINIRNGDISSAVNNCESEILESNINLSEGVSNITGFQLNRAIANSQFAYYIFNVIRDSNIELKSDLEEYIIKVNRNDDNYIISDIKSKSQRELYIKNNAIRIIGEKGGKSSLVISLNNIPKDTYLRENKIMLYKEKVPNNSFGKVVLGFTGKKIAISAIDDKNSYICIAYIDDTLMKSGSDIVDLNNNSSVALSEGLQEALEKPVTSKVVSVDLLNNCKIDDFIFSKEDDNLAVNYKNEKGLNRLNIYKAEDGEAINTKFKDIFNEYIYNIKAEYFVDNKVIFDVFKSDQSIDEMTGKYSLDLTNEEMIKL